MSKLIKLFIIPLFVFAMSLNLKAQSGTIILDVLTVDVMELASFAIEKNIPNQRRIMQVTIIPEGTEVIVEGSVSWLKNNHSSPQDILNFRTRPFKARTFSNLDIGNSEIDFEYKNYDTDLIKDNFDRNKPSGTYIISVRLFNNTGIELIDDDMKKIEFLNPTAPQINLPAENSLQDIGAVMISWTESVGVKNYRIAANYINEGQSAEEALNSGNLLVNNFDVGPITSVNMRDILNRELLPDKKVVLVVKAVVTVIGGEDELQSEPIIFLTSSQTSTSNNQNIQVDLNILQLAELLSGKVSQNFINQLKNGEVTIDQIQITDENNNNVSFGDLLSLLNYLNANGQSLISIQFTAQ